MERSPHLGAPSEASKHFPRDQTSKSFWRSPTAWIILALLLVPLIVLERAIQFRLNGWRADARAKATRLYEALKTKGASGVDRSFMRDGTGVINLDTYDQMFGRVKEYRIEDLNESGSGEVFVELSVTRGSVGMAREILTIDSDGRIVSLDRMQRAPPPPPRGWIRHTP